MAPAVRVSRLPVGSSASSTRGALTSARAIATRCCSPPESADGTRRCAGPSRPTSRRSIAACARASRQDAPSMRRGHATFSSAVRFAKRLKAWNTKPTCRRRRSLRASSERSASARPSRMTVPVVGRSIPGDEVQERALPRPARSDQGRELALGDPQAHVGERPRVRRRVRVTLPDAGELDRGCHGGRHSYLSAAVASRRAAARAGSRAASTATTTVAAATRASRPHGTWSSTIHPSKLGSVA